MPSGTTPLFSYEEDFEAVLRDKSAQRDWLAAATRFCGGTLRGLTTKLGYLKRLGVTTLWVSPVLKQCAYSPESYHGYGTQDFLAVDPHFGTADDLRTLVQTAHELGIYVILDIILNHAGDVFAYVGDAGPDWRPEAYPVAGFRDAIGNPALPFGPIDLTRHPDAYPEGAIWPRELQDPCCWTRRGIIRDWDHYPEFMEGDFCAFKDLYLGDALDFEPTPALLALTDVYQFWLAFADLDGFRLDTVKHMPDAAVRYFVDRIHGFARGIGKPNFLIVGEIVGAREQSVSKLRATGLDAALGIGEIPLKIRRVIGGSADPSEYFEIFANSRKEGEAHPEPVWWKDRVVTFFDDHDQVGKDVKGRLAADFDGNRVRSEKAVLRAVGFQATTLGIPCLYYGTEQGFDGCRWKSPDGVPSEEPADACETPPGLTLPDDFCLREAMFGGAYGAFRSQNRHCFAEDAPLYREVSQILGLRRKHPVLRRGRQYLRETCARFLWTARSSGFRHPASNLTVA